MNPVVAWCDFPLSLIFISCKATASMCHKKYPFLLRNVVIFLVTFKKEVYYLKLWRRNDIKFMEIKFFHAIKK